MVGAEPHQIVAEVVERALVLGVVGAGQPVTHDHVCLTLGHGGDHLGRSLSRIGVVAVHKDVRLGVYFAEHAAHDIALALLVLMADDRPGSGGQFGRAIGRVVVVDIDRSVRQDAAEIRDDLFNGLGFVVARDQDGDFIHNIPPGIYIQN